MCAFSPHTPRWALISSCWLLKSLVFPKHLAGICHVAPMSPTPGSQLNKFWWAGGDQMLRVLRAELQHLDSQLLLLSKMSVSAVSGLSKCFCHISHPQKPTWIIRKDAHPRLQSWALGWVSWGLQVFKVEGGPSG